MSRARSDADEAGLVFPRRRGSGPSSRWAPASAGPLSRNGESGFTLLEMLVALAIFSLAALALLRLGGATVANTVRLQDQAIAQIVARNIAAETLSDPMPPAYGSESGRRTNAGRSWSWTRATGRSPEPRIQQIEIVVASERGPEAARLTVFRRSGP
ncbi:MAG: type II secretion system minor pseudopilin GspI [Sphingomonadaceae bacterium]